MLFGLLGTTLGSARGQSQLAALSLSILLWVFFEWLWFEFCLRLVLPRLRFSRRVNGRPDSTGTLWAGRRARVDLQVSMQVARATLVQIVGPTMLRGVVIRDVLPEILQPEALVDSVNPQGDAGWRYPFALSILRRVLVFCLGPHLTATPRQLETHRLHEWRLSGGQLPTTFSYEICPRAIGRAGLPGVRMSLADPFGLFACHRFVPLDQSFRILPDYFHSGDIRPTVKRHNALPSHGIHRLFRSGVSSELLELREYVAGDPPKSIAWKASARRDKLMTRQYESEVPVRLRFFMDGSLSTRLGGFGLRMLDQTSYVAASLAKAALSVGDPVSATLVDESHAQRLPWFSGDLGFMQMLRALADFAERVPPSTHRLTARLLQSGYDLCDERYPQLMDGRYNLIPFAWRASQRSKHRLIGVLGQVLELSVVEQVDCYRSDACLADALQRFLHASGLPWMSPLLPERIDIDANCARVANLLQQSIMRAVTSARDNEVLVVLADPHTCAQYLNRLLPAVKLALAKHHRVAFVCPTPTFSRPQAAAFKTSSDSVRDLLVVAEQARMRDLRDKLKRELVRLGVAVTYSGERNAIKMILAEMDMARAGRSRMQGTRI